MSFIEQQDEWLYAEKRYMSLDSMQKLNPDSQGMTAFLTA
jgi:hypothetical protein